MKTQLIRIVIVSAASLFTSSVVAQGLSFRTLNTCAKDYTEILNTKEEGMAVIEELPPGIYLARSVVQSFEKSDEKYFSYHTLLAESKQSELCFEGNTNSAFKTQSFIPTLIDQTSDQKLGHTFWSFSAVLDKSTGAVNSKRSLIPNKDYREALKSQGYKVISTQKTHDEFQIRLEREISYWKETIVIKYDTFKQGTI